MTRKQKKAEQELLDQALFDEAKQAITMKNFILEADHVMVLSTVHRPSVS